MSDPACPNPNELTDYLLGKLPDERSDVLVQHIEGCETCQDTILSLNNTSDTLVSNIRGAVPEDEFEMEPACQDALAAIAAIGRDPSFVGNKSGAAGGQEPTELGSVREYKLLTKLGEGGMGAVYKALHTKLDKIVALKVLPADRMKAPDAVERFEREMKAVGKLSHPNIVAAHDAGEIDDTHYLVMELVDGPDVSDLVQRFQEATESKAAGLPVAEACEIIRQAAEGLQHAHERGMVHRDIKPSNLMLQTAGGMASGGRDPTDPSTADVATQQPARTGPSPEPVVKVLDMGLALFDERHQKGVKELTGTGQMMGTIDYMAPEQGGDSHKVDIRADVYALGATLYKLLAGRAPFADEKYEAVINKLMALATQPPTPLHERREDVPRELSDYVSRLLSKTPDGRPATPREVADALTPFAEGARLGDLLQFVKQAHASETDRTSDTFAHLSSSFTDTHRPASGRPTPRAASRSKPSVRPWLPIAAGIAIVFLPAAFLGPWLWGILFKVETPHGTITIEVPKGEEGNIEIAVLKGANLVRILDTANDWTIELEDGDYKLDVRKGGDRFEIKDNHLTVTQGKRARVKVTVRRTEVLAESRAFPPSEWVDVLGQINLDEHCVFGRWLREGNGLVSMPMGFTRVGSPITANDSYEALVRFRWIQQIGPVNLLLPVGNTRAQVWLERNKCGIGSFRGVGNSAPIKSWKFEPDRSYEVRVTVQIDGEMGNIDVMLDGQKFMRWHGLLSAAYPRSDWVIPEKTFGFGPHNCAVCLEEYRVRPLDGSRLLRKTLRLEQVGIKPGTTIDLAPLVDPDKHAVLGEWDVAEGVIKCTGPREFARLVIPIVPAGDYELAGTILRQVKLNPSSVALPVGASYTGVEIKDKRVLLERIIGTPPWKRADVEMDGETDFAIRVRDAAGTARIEIAIDGKSVLEWQGPTAAAQPRFDWVFHPTTLGIGTHGGLVEFRDLKFKLISGTVNLLVEEVTPIQLPATADSKSSVPFPTSGTAEEKKTWLVAQLMRLNPGFDGNVEFTTIRNEIIEIRLSNLQITDVSPLANLKHLRVLSMPGHHPKRGPFADLGPVRGLPLEELDVGCSQVADLEPIRGMPLKILSVGCTRVSDLGPLAGMPLEKLSCHDTDVASLKPLEGLRLRWLMCGRTKIKDLSALAEMPLEYLYCNHCPVSDISPLKNAPLTFLRIENTGIRDLSPVRNCPLETVWGIGKCTNALEVLGTIPTLKKIDDRKATDVLEKRAAANSAPPPFPATGAIEHKQVWVETEFKRLNPGLNDAGHFNIRDGKIVAFSANGLAGLRDIGSLSCLENLQGVQLIETGVTDLSPLAGLPLRVVDLSGSPVTDLTPLADCPLENITCSLDLERDGPVLRSIETLKTINGKPAGEVLGGE